MSPRATGRPMQAAVLSLVMWTTAAWGQPGSPGSATAGPQLDPKPGTRPGPKVGMKVGTRGMKVGTRAQPGAPATPPKVDTRPHQKVGTRPHHIGNIPLILQGKPPFCTAAAGLMAAARLGPVPPLPNFVRTLPVSAQGIPLLELTEALRPLGLDGRIALLNDTDLRMALAANVPVMLMVRAGAGRHAVLAVGYDASGLTVHDPQLPTPARWTWTQVADRWQPAQAVVLLPLRHPPDHLPLAAWARADAEHRALEWALRAEADGLSGLERLALYDRATEAASWLKPIAYNRAQLLLAVGRRAEGCATLAALAREGAIWAGPALEAARCPPPDVRTHPSNTSAP